MPSWRAALRLPSSARRRVRSLVVIAAIFIVSGCAPAAPSLVTGSPSISVEVMTAALAFRVQFGLRSDPAWIEAVEHDPAASARAFGVRLLPAELADLEARARNANVVVPVVRAYGLQHLDVYGGSYIDQEHGGQVVVLVTDEPATHIAALAQQLHPSANWAVRDVAFSQAMLEALHERINADVPWFEANGIALGSVATDVAGNQIELVFFSSDPFGGDRIREHLSAGRMLNLVLDRNVVALLPRGALRGRVVSSSGSSVADLLINAIGDIGNAEPDGGIAYGTDTDGTFLIPSLPAMTWEVQALIGVPGADWRVLGSTRVAVGDNTTSVVIINVP